MEDFEDIDNETLIELIIEERKQFYKENEAAHREELKNKQNLLFGRINNEDFSPLVPPLASKSMILPLIDEANKDGDLALLDKIGFIATRLDKMVESKDFLEVNWRNKNGDKKIPEKQQVNFTDPKSSIMTTKQHGIQQCYNHFAVVDQKANIILGTSTTNSSNDKEGFIPAFDHTEKLLGSLVGLEAGAGADAGFFSANIIKYGLEKGMDLYLSFPCPESRFAKDKFVYNQKEDHYTCPEGKTGSCS